MLSEIAIPPADPARRARVSARIDGKTKPPGSLGAIERLALELAEAQGTDRPAARPATLLLFAADHGLVAEGVSAWPQEVTALMVRTFLGGGAASTVFARSVGAAVRVCDAGVAGGLDDVAGLARAGIRRGTRNAAREDAMTAGECAAALRFGADQAQAAVADGARVVALGEMGIGNTAAAALVAHALSGIALEALVGPGAGLDPAGVAHKRAVLIRAAARHPVSLAPEAALAAYGGLEIAAMAGAVVGAAGAGAAVLVDGFIATAAAAAALAARPEARRACLFAHCGAEPGHAPLLAHLGAEPPLSLGLRLGEGTGALLALPLLAAAAAMLEEMASLSDAGISGNA